ncbi:MAG: phosphoribosyl-AMP cyclohydrolase [Bacteroidota bacterium]
MIETLLKELRFDTNGLIPAVVQDAATGEVLMVAYMNQESLRRTIETGRATYWSRSRQKLWTKGEESGHFQYVQHLCIDCDGDALLLKVKQVGAACHTGHYSCFYREVAFGGMERIRFIEKDDFRQSAAVSEKSPRR